MKHHLKHLLLCLCLFAGTNAFAYDAAIIDSIYYHFYDGDNARVTYYDYNYYSGNIVIPASVTYNGKPYSVTSIESGAFYGCSGLTSITIPNSVTSIGGEAFYGCSSLTSVTIPNSVTTIGSDAFEGCSNLTSVIIGRNVSSIGLCIFSGCINLKKIEVSSSNQKYISSGNAIIERDTYKLIAGCCNTIIPGNVQEIGESAFTSSGISAIIIPSSVKKIYQGAFFDCKYLKHVTLYSNALVSTNYAYYYSFSDLFGKQVKEYVIGHGVTSIGDYAFYNCQDMTSVIIPNSVTSIGGDAFSGCDNLTSVIIPESVTSIGQGAFTFCEKLATVTIESDAIVSASRNWENPITSSFGDNVKEIVIGNSVTSIGKCAFYECRSVQSVIIPNSVKSIGDEAFVRCNSLTSITLPDSVTCLGKFAFYGCDDLTSITIGRGMKTINSFSFANCPKLSDVYCYAEDVPNTNSNAFEESSIESATLYVPEISINLYKTTPPWSCFGKIVPIEDLGFDEEHRILLARYDELLIIAKEKLAAITKEILSEDGLIQDTSQFSSPYTEQSEGSIAALMDGDTNTFWHSNWTDGSVAGGTHYLQADLDNPVDMKICATFTRRPVLNDHVTNMSVYGTNTPNADKTACEELLTFACPYSSNTETIISPSFNTKGYRYLRFYANTTTSNHGYWHISEFQLYRIILEANTLVDYLDGEDERLQTIIDEQSSLRRFQIGEAEYNALKEAYDALINNITDVIDAIRNVNDKENASEIAHYDMQGRMIAKPTKGINIIRYSDGTTKKVKK